MSNLYWYGTCTFSINKRKQNPLTNYKINAKGFELVYERDLSPILKQYLFKKDNQTIQVYLYVNADSEELMLFVQDGILKEAFIDNLSSSKFYGFRYDVFISANIPEQIIKEIEVALTVAEEPDSLHIYGQASWHQDAFIVGHRSALIQLRDAIDQAIQYGEKRQVFFPEDGEGYSLYISCIDDSFDLNALDAPYHDPTIFPEKPKAPIKAFELYNIKE